MHIWPLNYYDSSVKTVIKVLLFCSFLCCFLSVLYSQYFRVPLDPPFLPVYLPPIAEGAGVLFLYLFSQTRNFCSV